MGVSWKYITVDFRVGHPLRGDGEEKNSRNVRGEKTGKGRIIIFGYGLFPPFNREIVAWDIMQIIHSGILYSEGEIRYKKYALKRETDVEDSIEIRNKSSNEKIIILIFSKDPYHSFHCKMIVDPTNHTNKNIDYNI